VLKDGSDSVGVLGALNRVYLNIGLFSEEWTLHFRPVIGGRKISPIRIADAQKNSAYWGATEDMTADMALFFLATATPDRLKDVAGAARHLPKDEAQVRKGKVVFARNCAACHSSKIPLPPEGSGVDEGSCARGGNGPQYRECWDRYWSWANSEPFKRAMTEIVLDERFLENNFLSTERRVPVDLLKTNACSALATNALAGDIWDNFSSTSYKQLPPVKELTVHHPVSGGERSLQPLGNGRGYSRPASLVSLWSTAPYLQNNSVGHDPSYYPVAQDYGYGAGNTGGTPAYSRAAYGEDAPPVGTGYAGEKTEQPPAPTQGTAPYNTGSAGSGVSCPAKDGSDPYLPCVDNRMQVFDQSIRELLDPGKRRLDPVLPEETRAKVGGYLYRTTANSCLVVPKGYLPLGLGNVPWLTNALADWAFAENGDLTLGPLPKDFPVNALVNTKLLPDNDEPAGMSHYWRLGKASFTLLSTFKQLGGTCSSEELDDPKTQLRAEKVLRETGFIDTLVGLSKCPDYVVNRGHEFGKDLTPAEREDLIAFLKLL
jgi:hypothetical protein